MTHPRLRAALVAATTLVALGAAAPGVAVAAPSASSRYESDTVTHANAERTKAKKKAVKASSCVDRYAERQARAMAKKQQLYHQDLAPILKKCKLRSVGENVAYGYPNGKAVTKAWMASTGHRANLLRSEYRLIGVGAVKDGDGRWYVAQVFGRAA